MALTLTAIIRATIDGCDHQPGPLNVGGCTRNHECTRIALPVALTRAKWEAYARRRARGRYVRTSFHNGIGDSCQYWRRADHDGLRVPQRPTDPRRSPPDPRRVPPRPGYGVLPYRWCRHSSCQFQPRRRATRVMRCILCLPCLEQ